MSFAIKNSLTKGILIKYVGDAVRLALRKHMREGMMMMIIDGSQLIFLGHQLYWIRAHPNDIILTQSSPKDPVSKPSYILRFQELG